jgi:prepilin-type N-terminal cleavage/methylation domain-containing protein
MGRRQAAFSLIELLVVLALLALLAGASWTALRIGSAERAARGYLRTVQAVRIDAVAGRPGAVRWRPEEGAFVLRRGDDACTAPVVRRWRPEGRVAVTRWLRSGVAWLPDGTGRGCDGGGVYGGRVRFEDGRAAWDVVVASTGRLRAERVP